MHTIVKIAVFALVGVGAAWAQDFERDGPRMPGDSGHESTEEQKAARETAINQLEACDVLGVFAHPDDETFSSGTFALLSAKGQRVQLVYATSGDAGGDKTDRELSGQALADVREGEMRSGARVMQLATEPLFLRYPDGLVYDHWNEVVESVQQIIKQTQPKIVVTFGPDGLYGHADHVAIGQITGRAFDDSEGPTHLLHTALSRTRHTLVANANPEIGERYKAVADRFITYSVDVSAQLEQRVGAISAHKTQFEPEFVQQFRMLAAITRVEDFVEVRHPGETGLLSELFSK